MAKSSAATKSKKYVYFFGNKKADGDGSMKALLGGKGANLAEMTRIGLPVPPGFTMSTEVCTYYYANKQTYPKVLKQQAEEGVRNMERIMGKKFGDSEKPLLVSVRSGARESMPGMMDTILNLGLNDNTVQGLAKVSGNERFAWDCYRRFIQMYGDVVMGVQTRPGEDLEPFEQVIEGLKNERFPNEEDVKDTRLNAEDLKELVKRFKSLVKERTGKAFPNDPWDQLWGAVGAVFGSWMNERAIVYRRRYGIPVEWGTAVNVQAMVFGNTGEKSGSGVAFTRDPATGEKVFYGEFLMNAQGEDVVAGVRTPEPVIELKKQMPHAYKELEDVRKKLEQHFHDLQDFEFTIEDEEVFMLQTRSGKRTGLAAVRIAIEMVKEKLIDWEEALKLVPAEQLDQVLAPVFDRKASKGAEVVATGLPAGPGAASGHIYFNADRAAEASEHKDSVLLVRVETSPEDLRGMIAANGILTARGGVSSHAALVARQMGKVCVCGAQALQIDYEARTLRIGDKVFKEGDNLSIDGTSGEVYEGRLPTAPSEIYQVLVQKSLQPSESRVYQNYAKIMDWSKRAARMTVRTNSDSPEQVETAVVFGATGIGLCRTEHMFFEGDRIDAVREMILANSTEDRRKALSKLLPYQRDDFKGIFRALKGKPATIRLLDPPLHEFLPSEDHLIKDLAKKIGLGVDQVKQRISELHELNPMLGHRGCRLGVVYPEISEMQARAIFEAAAEVQKDGVRVRPEIMIPLVGFPRELQLQKETISEVASKVGKEKSARFNYLVGTMIEVPRATVVADEIANDADFFSFGTNDLTQTGLGMSRDDSGSFLPKYTELEIVKRNPFASIDEGGIGKLMKTAVELGRSSRPDIKLGICGEHGGDPASVKFCHQLGLDYVSCSPFRVPTARLAAAQAAIDEKRKQETTKQVKAKSAKSSAKRAGAATAKTKGR